MNDTDSRLLGYFDAAAEGFSDRLRAVPDTYWESATPCTEWNVWQLVNHMIQGSRIYTSLLRGGSSAEFMANLDQETLDGDLVTTYSGAVAECRAAFHAAGALDRIVDYPFGPVPGRQLLGLYVVDAITHTWDLARAARLDERLDAPTVQWVLDNFQWIYHGVSESPITDGNRYYGPPTEAPTPATSAQDRLLRTMGRRLDQG
ncbi:TIGR03086 family protein [Streptomyces rectiverticillatus]|uniref:TIGR03086 family metal-binding protein n=1 Tax=Streptomyces rectiverticillatus TaxID=173860 RepID=UPI0015C301F7|nr:TIGR03086 family metal-binding protein [Streptomyces rectiverticillatus]QLE71142.1 TIGR03086 family protein [Streptomyces rectiverticillatus]